MSEQVEVEAYPKVHHYMNADGTCHAGDLFERGVEFIVLYTADELVRIVNAEKAEAWDQGHRDVCTDCNCHPEINRYRPTPHAQPRDHETGASA